MVLCCCKKIVCLTYGITSNHVGDFYWLNCLHLFSTEKKLKNHEKKKNYYCYIEMPKEDEKY